MTQESRAAVAARRSFLKAVGTSALAFPLYAMLENSVVYAQTASQPMRFAGFGLFHGTTQRLYSRRAGETATNFSLTYADSPFSPFDDAATYGQSFKNRVSIFEGFDHGVGEWAADGRPTHVPFHGAMGQLLTGSSPRDGTSLLNASLDQVLAEKYGGDTTFRSVRLRGLDMYAYPRDAGWTLSFGAGGAPLSTLELPADIWDAYFKTALVGTGAGADAQAARKRALGASVLDFIAKDATRLNTRLGPDERQKLDQHLTAIRGLERRLAEVSPATCSAPATRPRNFDKFKAGEVLTALDLQMDMFTELFTCGLTRYGTFLLPNETGPGATSTTDRFTGQPVPIADGTENDPAYYNFHDACAHRLDDGGTDALATFSQHQIAAINRFYFRRIARFMQRLSEAGMLDSTVIMMGGEGGYPSGHNTRDVPLLVAGGANGALSLGKRIVHPARAPRAGDSPSGRAWTSVNPVLAAVANLFGENLTSFGTCSDTSLTRSISGILG